MKKISLIISILLILSFSLLISTQLIKAYSAKSDSTVILNQTYYVGDYLKIPELKDDNGNDLQSLVEYPDGSLYQEDDISFKDSGLYKIKYVNENSYELYKTFELNVLDRIYHFSGSEIIYSNAKYGFDESKYNTGIKGLTVELYSGDTFYYDEIIDLRKCQDNEHCAFFKFFAIPEEMGKFDCERFRVRLTDIYNPNIYLDVYIFPYPQRNEIDDVPDTAEENWKYFDTFIEVAGQNQVSTGLGWNADGTYTVKRTDLSGFAGAHSMYGYSFRKCSVGKEILDLGLNLNTLEFMSTHRINGRSPVVCDLDDYMYMENAWDGFTTGEVKMEINAYMYRDAEIPFTFMITELGNNTNTLDKDIILDNEGPSIKVVSENKTIITNEYNLIPLVEVLDDYSKIKKVNTSVYYNYNSSNEYELEINDGYFFPTKDGTYTILYEAYDYFNNKSTLKVRVNATSGTINKMNLSFINTNNDTIKVGDSITLDEYTINSNSADILKIEKTFSLNDELIELSDNSYKFTTPGIYKLSYTAYDYYNNKTTITKEYQVFGEMKPIFDTEFVFPRYIIEGGTYEIPSVYAYDYNSENIVKIECIPSIDLGNGYEINTTGKFVANKTNDTLNEVSFRFIASNEYGTSYYYKTIPFISLKTNDKLDLTKAFVGENIEVKSTKEQIEITSIKTQKTTKYDFVNPVNVENLSFIFGIIEGKHSFDKIIITLTDYYNPNLSINFNISKLTDDTSLFNYNEFESYTISQGFKNAGTITFNYSNNNQKLTTSDFSIKIKTASDGTKFSGFESSLAYMSVEYVNVTGSAGLKFLKLNTQSLNNTEMDYVKPQVIIDGTYEPTYEHDEIVTIYKGIGVDVIDPSPSCLVTVKNSEGEIIKSLDGILLENVSSNRSYQIKLEYYGNYLVSYKATDNSNKSNTFMYVLEVCDTIAPSFNITNKEIDVKVDEAINISGVKVTDNYDSSINYKVYIIYPNADRLEISKDLEYISFSKRENYIIRFISIDESGNFASVEYKVNVR